MMFNERIKQLREARQLPQRKLAAALDIDTASYCKIERGERRARKEHLSILADILHADREELLTLWIADQVYEIVGDEDVKTEVINIVAENIVEYKKLSR